MEEAAAAGGDDEEGEQSESEQDLDLKSANIITGMEVFRF